LVRHVREPSRVEEEALSRILSALRRTDEQAVGKLYRETFPDEKLNRRAYEQLLSGLRRAGLVDVSEATFEKGGREITYQRVSLTDHGRTQSLSPSGVVLAALAKKSAKKPRSKSSKSRAKATSKTKATGKWFFVNRAKRAKKKSD
jgi:DNA-binding transcriptional ArsR family regulator